MFSRHFYSLQSTIFIFLSILGGWSINKNVRCATSCKIEPQRAKTVEMRVKTMQPCKVGGVPG